jgi:hypothetical protein
MDPPSASVRCGLCSPCVITGKAVLAGIWDDRHSGTHRDFGGHCLHGEDADEALGDPDAEVLDIEVSSDGQLAGFLDESGKPTSRLKCVRQAASSTYVLIRAFGRECVDPADQSLYEEYLVCSMHMFRFQTG